MDGTTTQVPNRTSHAGGLRSLHGLFNHQLLLLRNGLRLFVCVLQNYFLK